jgi:lipopolysaccharide transport system ATP-binding protein
MRPVIEVDGLSKMYTIRHEDGVDRNSLRETVVRAARKPVAAIRGHHTRSEQFWALRDIGFEAELGEAVGIIGRNGSGKSTLLKILSRIVEPTAGRAILRGNVASLLEVGTGFHPELTGRENIYFNGSILGMSRRELNRKFSEIVEFAGTERFLDTPVKFYSSGMYVRLAFAIAAHLEPTILIVDEVLAVGDAQFQQKCLGKMGEVAGEGRTVLFVSHNLGAVTRLCRKGIYLEAGVAKRIGDIKDVADEYVASVYDPEASDKLGDRPREELLSLEAMFQEVRVNGHAARDNQPVDSKEPIQIEFVVDADRDLPEPLALHVAIKDASGTVVLKLHSEFSNTTFTLSKGINRIVCDAEPTHLAGGVYTIDCSLLVEGGGMYDHIDVVLDAFRFNVKQYVVPGTRELLSQRDATYFVPHRWRHVS